MSYHDHNDELVDEVKKALRLDELEASVNALYRATQRPGAEFGGGLNDRDLERKSAPRNVPGPPRPVDEAR